MVVAQSRASGHAAALDELIELATLEAHPLAIRAKPDLNAAAFGNDKDGSIKRVTHRDSPCSCHSCQ